MRIGPVSDIRNAPASIQPKQVARPGDFAAHLSQQLNEKSITVSVHAADRMARRGIVLSNETVNSIGGAFELAASKGAKKALFLLDDLAVVASIKDRTVMTALDRTRLAEGVFTNIDTAVVVSSHDDNQQSIMNAPSERRSSTEEAWMAKGGSQP